MGKLPHISQQRRQVVNQPVDRFVPDSGYGERARETRQFGEFAQDILSTAKSGLQDVKKEQELQEEFSMRMDALNTKNQVDDAGHNFNKGMLLLQDEYKSNPLGMVDADGQENYQDRVKELVDSNAESITNQSARDQYYQDTEIPIIKNGLQATAWRNEVVIAKGKDNLTQKLDSYKDDPNRNLLAQDAVNQAEDFGVIADGGAVMQNTIESWVMNDAGQSIKSAEEVLKKLGDPKDKTYPLSEESKNTVFNKVNQTLKRMKVEEKLKTEEDAVAGLATADEISMGSGTYEQKYWQIEQTAIDFGLTEKEKKSYHSVNNSAHNVDPKTNADTLLDLTARLNGLDLSNSANAEYTPYLKAVRRLVEDTNNQYAKGKLSYKNYRQIVGKIKKKTAEKNNEAVAGTVDNEDSWFGLSTEEAYSKFQSGTNSKTEADKLYIDYFSLVSGEDVSDDKKEELVTALLENNNNRKKSNAMSIMNSVLVPERKIVAKYSVGQIVNGHEFLGGNYKDKTNWKKVK